MIKRRDFLAALAAIAVRPPQRVGSLRGPGRLAARSHPPRASTLPGLASLGLSHERDTQVYVPTTYRADRSTGLILGLHGATQDSRFTLRILRDAAEAHGQLLLAPNSRQVTWDLVHGNFGRDEELIDKALKWTFDHCNVDPGHVTVAGFSDGATAALSLGLINGDLFRHIVAFSPAFIVGDERHGKPPIFISHGTRDQILPIDETSERIVPLLRRQGYAVEYHRFDGPHQAPPDIVAAAMLWLAQQR